MKIVYRIELFAIAREIAGKDFAEVSGPAEITAGGLRELMARQYPRLEKITAASRLAVDESYVDDDTVIGGESALALIPPVSGG